MICERPRCNKPAPGDQLYCCEACYQLDNDPNPIQPLARNKIGGFGLEVFRMVPQPVFLYRKEES